MRIKNLISTIIIVLCLASHNELYAQATIHISPTTGSVIAAASYGDENHLDGYGGVWVHEQVFMVWMTSDNEYLTSNGILRDHANNIKPIEASTSTNEKFVITCGAEPDGYFALALPKGYRFTSYKIKLTNNVSTTDCSNQSNVTRSLYETQSDFSLTNSYINVNLGQRSPTSTTVYNLSRTSVNENDMGNILYFRLNHGNSEEHLVSVYVTSFEITFECANPITEPLRPTTGIVDGVDCTNITVNTGRVDLGPIIWSRGNNTSSSNYQFRYDYTNVKDLTADFTLYNEGGIVDGTAVPGTTTEGNIEADDNYFFLNNDTYYIETPTEAKAQGGATRPLGYRITGAKLHYNTPFTTVVDIYITDNSGRYLGHDCKFGDTPVVWKINANGKVWTTFGNANYYLQITRTGISPTGLTTVQSASRGDEFVLEGENIYLLSS